MNEERNMQEFDAKKQWTGRKAMEGALFVVLSVALIVIGLIVFK